MKFGVVVFPGSNCDMDMIHVIEKILHKQVVKLWHKNTDLQEVDCVILPGGFSYGDYLRSGAIAQFSPIMNEVIGFANAGGLVIGICNGFQILTECGLLPGALLHNTTNKFICKNVYIKTISNNSMISKYSKKYILKIPIAHAEGRYYADNETINDLIKNDQIIFKYCDKDGNVNDKFNPNGSLHNIAGICNLERNVYGMMPHPERAADTYLSNVDGRLLFDSLIQNF